MESKILYNVTVKVLNEIAEEWLQWMQEKHIPDVMATQKFESYKLTEIFDDAPDGKTFAIQYLSPNLKEFEEYQSHFAKALQKEHTEKYANQYVAFRTLMKLISEG